MTKEGYLKYFKAAIKHNPPEAPVVQLTIQLKDAECTGWTDTRIVTLVLETALHAGRGKRIWPVEVTTKGKVSRVRVRDDREDVCKRVLDSYGGLPILPLSPTAFADESPPKWGFFFSQSGDCIELKGMSLDLYVIVEQAWREGREVVLELNDDERIVGVRPAS